MTKSCPLYHFKAFQDIFMKLHTNIKHQNSFLCNFSYIWHYSRYGLNAITLMLLMTYALNQKMKLFPLVSLLTIRIFNLSAIHRWKQLLLTTTTPTPAFPSLPIYIFYLYRYFISLSESAMGVV